LKRLKELTTMFAAPEQLVELNKSSLDAAMQFARLSFDAAERLVALNLHVGRETLAEVAKQTRALTDVKDVQEYVAWRTQSAEVGAEKAMSYSKSLYEVAQHAQAEVSQLVETRMSDTNKQVGAALDKAMKSAPAGADVILAAVKSGVAATSAAMDTVTKAVKQVSSLTDAGFKAAASNGAAPKAGRK
jgi:phasin family protein